MTRVSEQWVHMNTAFLWAQRSTCSRLNVGAVLVRDGRIIATGYNGNVAGSPHCEHIDDEPCTTAVHAEENVLYFAARNGVSTQGSSLYVTHNPCARCARGLVNAGVCRVVYFHDYRDKSGVDLLINSGVAVFQWDEDFG